MEKNQEDKMNKRMVSFFTLIVFTVFTYSCYTIQKEHIRTFASRKGKKVKILEVFKTTGELVEFSTHSAGRVSGDKIVGVVNVDGKKELVSIPFSEVRWIWLKRFDLFKTICALLAIWGVNSFMIYF